jgi:hypothetical protein
MLKTRPKLNKLTLFNLWLKNPTNQYDTLYKACEGKLFIINDLAPKPFWRYEILSLDNNECNMVNVNFPDFFQYSVDRFRVDLVGNDRLEYVEN